MLFSHLVLHSYFCSIECMANLTHVLKGSCKQTWYYPRRLHEWTLHSPRWCSSLPQSGKNSFYQKNYLFPVTCICHETGLWCGVLKTYIVYNFTCVQVAFNIIEDELGQPLEAIFSKISPQTIAAASLGQVYRATLRDTGEDVAIKVYLIQSNFPNFSYIHNYMYTCICKCHWW